MINVKCLEQYPAHGKGCIYVGYHYYNKCFFVPHRARCLIGKTDIE